MKDYKAQRITLRDIYLGYDHKYWDINSSTIPVPYFSKEEISNHEYALTFKQWKKVILCYFQCILRYLLSGQPLKLPHDLGEIRLKKWKPSKPRIDYYKTKQIYGEQKNVLPAERKWIYYKNIHSSNYSPLFRWYKYRSKFPYKKHWKIQLLPGAFRFISHSWMKDVSLPNRISET